MITIDHLNTSDDVAIVALMGLVTGLLSRLPRPELDQMLVELAEDAQTARDHDLNGHAAKHKAATELAAFLLQSAR